MKWGLLGEGEAFGGKRGEKCAWTRPPAPSHPFSHTSHPCSPHQLQTKLYPDHTFLSRRLSHAISLDTKYIHSAQPPNPQLKKGSTFESAPKTPSTPSPTTSPNPLSTHHKIHTSHTKTCFANIPLSTHTRSLEYNNLDEKAKDVIRDANSKRANPIRIDF